MGPQASLLVRNSSCPMSSFAIDRSLDVFSEEVKPVMEEEVPVEPKEDDVAPPTQRICKT